MRDWEGVEDEWEVEEDEVRVVEEDEVLVEEEQCTLVDPETEEVEGDWEEEASEEEGRVQQRPERWSLSTQYDSQWVHPCAPQSRCRSSSRIVSSLSPHPFPRP